VDTSSRSCSRPRCATRDLDRLPGQVGRRGAPAPLIAVAVLQHNGGTAPTLLAVYLGAAALVTFVAVLLARETRATDLLSAEPAVRAQERPAS
jgi:hypothetical protein